MSGKRKHYSNTSILSKPSEKDLTRQIEKLFEKPDAEIEPIAYNDSRSYVKALKTALADASCSKEWDDQLAALTQIMGLIKGGACSYSAFVQLIPNTVPLISQNICVLRSTLVKTSCLLVAQIAMTIGPHFEASAESLIPVLIKHTMNGTQIISDSCIHAIQCIAHYVSTIKIAKCVVKQCTSKSSVHRALCASCFVIIIRFWDKKVLEKVASIIYPAIDKLTEDASPEARTNARYAKDMFSKLNIPISHESPVVDVNKPRYSSTRRRNSLANAKKIINSDKGVRLDDIKQMIIMDQEDKIVENADSIAKIIIDGLTGVNPETTITCFTLFSETVNYIAATYKKHFDQIVKALFNYDSGINLRYKKLADAALESAASAFDPSEVILFGLNGKDPFSNREILEILYEKNESKITERAKKQYQKVFNPYDYSSKSSSVQEENSITESDKEISETNEQKEELPSTDEKVDIDNEPNPVIEQKEIEEPQIITAEKPSSSIIEADEEEDAIKPIISSDDEDLEQQIPDEDVNKVDENERIVEEKSNSYLVKERVKTSYYNEIKRNERGPEKKIEKEDYNTLLDNDIPKKRTSSVKSRQRKQEVVSTPQKKERKGFVGTPTRQSYSPKKSRETSDYRRQTTKPRQMELDPVQEPISQIEKLVMLLNGENTEGALKRIFQYTNKHHGRDFKVILPRVLPFWHTEFKAEAQMIIDAIISNVQHPQLLTTGSALLLAFPREASEFLGLVSKYCSAGEIMDAAPLFMDGLKRLAQDPLPEIRKSSVFCIVDLWIAAGDDFVYEVNNLPLLTKKLVIHYYNQKV